MTVGIILIALSLVSSIFMGIQTHIKRSEQEEQVTLKNPCVQIEQVKTTKSSGNSMDAPNPKNQIIESLNGTGEDEEVMNPTFSAPLVACLVTAEKLATKKQEPFNSCLADVEKLVTKKLNKDEFEEILETAHYQSRRYTPIPDGLINQIRETLIKKYPNQTLDWRDGVAQMESYFRLQKIRRELPDLKLILDREAGSYPNDFSQQLISLTILLESEKYKNIYSVLKYQKCLYDF